MMSLTTDSGGQSKAQNSQGDHSAAAPAGSCQLNGFLVAQGACTKQFRTSPLAQLHWPRPALGIDNASIIKKKDPNSGAESFFLVFLGSNNTYDTARPLVAKSKLVASSGMPFSLAGAGSLCQPYYSLEDIKKFSGLPCVLERTTTDLPVLVECPIPKEEACPQDGEAGLEIVLAAGNLCRGSGTDPQTGYFNPPQFCAKGTIDGFVGVLSNRFAPKAVPGTCS
jgi:hypothetical protein